MTALLLLLFAICGTPIEVRDHFDMLEVNHVHNQYGSVSFVQLIYWDWYRQDRKFHAQGWKIMNDAFDISDPEHQRLYEAALDRWLSRVTDAATWSRIRSHMKYKGKFVGGRLYPMKDYRTGRYQVRYHDDQGVMRLITADIFRETYTRNDPEVEDRKYLSVEARRGLTNPRARVTD